MTDGKFAPDPNGYFIFFIKSSERDEAEDAKKQYESPVGMMWYEARQEASIALGVPCEALGWGKYNKPQEESDAEAYEPESKPEERLKVNSIGTCRKCGYHGPGPEHPCLVEPKPGEEEPTFWKKTWPRRKKETPASPSFTRASWCTQFYMICLTREAAEPPFVYHVEVSRLARQLKCFEGPNWQKLVKEAKEWTLAYHRGEEEGDWK